MYRDGELVDVKKENLTVGVRVSRVKLAECQETKRNRI
jgi:hypothetical protein